MECEREEAFMDAHGSVEKDYVGNLPFIAGSEAETAVMA